MPAIDTRKNGRVGMLLRALRAVRDCGPVTRAEYEIWRDVERRARGLGPGATGLEDTDAPKGRRQRPTPRDLLARRLSAAIEALVERSLSWAPDGALVIPRRAFPDARGTRTDSLRDGAALAASVFQAATGQSAMILFRRIEAKPGRRPESPTRVAGASTPADRLRAAQEAVLETARRFGLELWPLAPAGAPMPAIRMAFESARRKPTKQNGLRQDGVSP